MTLDPRGDGPDNPRFPAHGEPPKARVRGTGARGLRAILEDVLLNTMYDLPSRTDVARVVIDADVVLERVNPTLIPITELGKEREERTA